MRVLVCSHCTVLGGANRSMLGLMDINRKQGVEYIVLLPDEGPICGELKKRKIKYHVLPYYNWVHYGNKNSKTKAIIKLAKNELISRKVARIIKTEKIDIVHTNDSLTLIGALAAKKAKVKHIWHIREFLDYDYTLNYNYSDSFVRKMYSSADAVVAISKVIEKHINNRFKLNNCVLVYNGLEQNDNEFEKEKEFLVSFSGGDSEKKGILDVLDAFEIILKTRNDIRLVIGGKFSNNALINKIKAFDRSDKIQIIGESKEWNSWLGKSHVSLVCSHMEAFGRVTVESMLAKAIVVATNTGANEEIITDGKEGYIYRIGDKEQLAGIICNVIDTYDSHKEMIENAYEKAKKDFSIEATADHIADLYTQILSKGEKDFGNERE